MGISKLFKEKTGMPQITAGDPDLVALDGDMPALPMKQDSAPADEATYEDEHGDKFLSEQEARRLAIRLAGEDQTAELLAAQAGVLAGRMVENYFAQNKDRLNETRTKDQKARTEIYYMMILQAQIDGLNARIVVLDGQINALDDLIERVQGGEKLDPNNPAHRRLLLKSGVPEDDWGGLTLRDLQDLRDQRQQRRDAIDDQRTRISQELKATAPENTAIVAQQAAKREGSAAVEAVADTMRGPTKNTVEKAAETHDDAGNAAHQTADTKYNFISTNNALGGGALSQGTSVASALSNKPGITGTAPPVRPEFAQASVLNAPAEPPMKTAFNPTKEENPPGTPTTNMG